MVRDVADPLVRLDLRVLRVTTGWSLRHDWLRTAAEVGRDRAAPLGVPDLRARRRLWCCGAVRARSAALWAASTMVVGTLLGAVLKLIVSRARPSLDDPVATATGFSFPSGHALNAALGVSLLVALLWRPACDRGRQALLLASADCSSCSPASTACCSACTSRATSSPGWIVGVLVVVSSWVAFGPVLRERARRGTEQAVEGDPPSRPHPTRGRRPTPHPQEGSMTGLVDPGSTRRTRAPRHLPTTTVGCPRSGEFVKRLGTHVLLPVIVWLGVLIGCGLLFAHPLKQAVSGEDGVNRWFLARRTPFWNDATNVMSHVANTGTIIITMFTAAFIVWLVSRRLREPVVLIIGVTFQALVFLFTTLVVSRARPDVPKLDTVAADVQLPVRPHGRGDGAVHRAGDPVRHAAAAALAAGAGGRRLRRRPVPRGARPPLPRDAPPHRRHLRPAQRRRLRHHRLPGLPPPRARRLTSLSPSPPANSPEFVRQRCPSRTSSGEFAMRRWGAFSPAGGRPRRWPADQPSGWAASSVAGAVEVLAEGDERLLDVPVPAVLAQTDVGREGVAQAGAADRVSDVAALAHVGVDRLGRAAVADAAVGALERDAQVPEVAQARACRADVGVAERAGQLRRP